MGRQKKIFISGRVANLIFYEFKGKECVRTMPKKVRQTKATKASAVLFGKAVQISRAVRDGLMPVLPNARERRLMHRFNNVILESLPRNTSPKSKPPLYPSNLKGFDFLEDIQFSSRWKVPLTIEWKKNTGATIIIPAFTPKQGISAPAYTKFVRLHLLITGCDVKNFENTGNHFITLSIPYNNVEIPAQNIDMPLEIGPGSMSIVAAVLVNGLKKETELLSNAGAEWNPASILDAFVS